MVQQGGRLMHRDQRPTTPNQNRLMKNTMNWLKWAGGCAVSATGSTLKLATGLTGSTVAAVTGVAGGVVAVAGGAVAVVGGGVYLGGMALMHEAYRLGNASAELSEHAVDELRGAPPQPVHEEAPPQGCPA